jgi:subtilisin family serine protease
VTASYEEATPDCGTVAAEPFPGRQRAQHLAQLGVDRWQAAGFRGQGVTIALLDSGFRGYRGQLGKALPAHVTCRSFRADGNLEAKDSQHGIMCAEVLHALAPDAGLLFANWEPDHPEQFLEAVRWARQEGARVISCSLIMPSWSDGDGGGPFNEALAQALGSGNRPDDVLFFASAGNTALRHWYGRFHANQQGLHEWRPGQTDNTMTPWGNDTVSVELYGHLTARYDLRVEDEATGTLVGHATAGAQTHQRCAEVRVQPRPQAAYRVKVHLDTGGAGDFHLVVLGGGLACATLNGSVACPADGPGVIAVGAVSRNGKRAAYSSCGSNSSHPKPDLVAPVPFPSLWRLRPFTGTSAAAPQAAGLAALCWSRHADWTPNQVRQALLKSARDLGPPGPDFETGYGMIALPPEEMADPWQSFQFPLLP